MKTFQEITVAHDILYAVVKNEVPHDFDEETVGKTIEPVLDALCWVLDHETGEDFQKNLDKVQAYMRHKGYSLSKVQ